MNAIEAFRKAQLEKQQSKNASQPASEQNVETEQKPSPTIREDRLKMYKKLNNMMMATRHQANQISLDWIPLTEGVAWCIDYVLQEMIQKGQTLNAVSSRSLFDFVQSLFKSSKIESCYVTPKESPDFDISTARLATDRLRTILNEEINQLNLQPVLLENTEEERTKLIISYAAEKGPRSFMEDEMCILQYGNEITGLASPPFSFFGLYDGHSGKIAADYTRGHLHFNIVRDSNFPTDIRAAITQAFNKTNYDFNQIAKEKEINSGTTVAVALISGDMIYIGNVGDTEVNQLFVFTTPKINTDIDLLF